MYDFAKLNNEEIKEIIDGARLLVAEEEKEISVIVTNQRVVFLEYPKDSVDETLRVSRGVQYMKRMEEFFNFNLSDLKEIIPDEYDKYMLKDGNYFFIKCTKLRELLNK